MCLQAKDSWETTFPCFLPREIDFVKKEEELKKILDEKDKWYKEQLKSLQNRVRPQFEENTKCLNGTTELLELLK